MHPRLAAEGIEKMENGMKSLTTSTTKRLLIAAAVALAPAGSALAAQDCRGDPFAPYRQAFYADGPAYACGAAPREAGARGPAGPIIVADDAAACRKDPHRRVQQALWADGPSSECVAVSGERAGAHGPAGPLMEEARSAASDPFYRYDQALTGD
jgi:hypothetical protein